MTKVEKNSLPSLLTPEEKKYLRMISRYLNSMGMKDGNIEIDSTWMNPDDIDFRYITAFSNNYRAEIPEGLFPIIEKVIKYAYDNDLYHSHDDEDINYEKLEIDIDTKKGEISLTHYWSYYRTDDGSSHRWNKEDSEFVFRKLEEGDVSVPNNGVLILEYNGSGDSGYINDSFNETNDAVPADVEDWCYQQLESLHGGWEINEGSQGSFEFDLNNMTITLYHSYNIEETDSKTLFEESFTE